MNSINPYPSRRSKTLLILELSPLRLRAAIAGQREGTLELIRFVEKSGFDEAAGIEAALAELGSLPSEALIVSSLALPFVVSSLPDSSQELSRREEMLRWELEPQISALIYAPGPSTLLHWQGKWKQESGDAMLGATIGLSSLNATQWRSSLISSGAVSKEELDRLSAVSDKWQGIPPPAGVAARSCADGGLVTAWSQPQVGLVAAALKSRKITLLGLLPMSGAAWALLPEGSEVRLLERMPGQFLLTSFDRNGKPELSWHQYHADQMPDSLLRELIAAPTKRLYVADDLGAAAILREALGSRASAEILELPLHAAIRGAASFALGMKCPVEPPAAGLLPPPRRLGKIEWSLLASAVLALASCLYFWRDGQNKMNTFDAAVAAQRQAVAEIKLQQSEEDKARTEAAELRKEIGELENRLAALKEEERQGQRISDRSAELAALLLASGRLGAGISLERIHAAANGEIAIHGQCSDVVEVQRAAAELNQNLAAAAYQPKFRVQTRRELGKAPSFILESKAAEVSP